MKIAILSDIHDEKAALGVILTEIRQKGCEMVFALGDYTTLEIFKQICNLHLPVYAVFGNMDLAQSAIEGWVKTASFTITLRQEMNRVRIGKSNVALTHFPAIAEKLLKSGMYNAVFFGHTHKSEQRREEDTLIANPGAVKEGSFGLYDSESNEIEMIQH